MEDILLVNYDDTAVIAQKRAEIPVIYSHAFIGPRNGCIHPLHCHDYFEIEFVTCGAITNTVNGISRTMKRGMLFLLSTNDIHRLENCEESVYLHKMSFRPDSMPSDMNEILKNLPMPLIQFYEGEELEKLTMEFNNFRRASEYADYKKTVSLLELRISAEAILLRIIKNAVNSEFLPTPSEPVMRGIHYIRKHLTEDIKLSDIAASVFLSADHFAYLFKKHTSLRVKEYIIECRMKLAYDLLTGSNMPIGEVAEKSGYRSLSLFYRHFEAAYQCTPAEVRRKNE
ncbi:MAG: helix-turn-helix domain-containing protein [Clostridia bacterium]|nr:helix-turn-helix domain-containing protein [Clostridia bacterium]